MKHSANLETSLMLHVCVEACRPKIRVGDRYSMAVRRI